MSDIQDFIGTMDKAVSKLADSAAVRQTAAFKELMGLTKTLETRGDVLLNNIKNLGIINKIKVKLERLIIDPQYKSDVKDFVGSYSQIQDLSNKYFSQFNAAYKPTATTKGIKQTAIESTLNGLFETGIQVGVTDGLRKILQTNINAGGSYAHLADQLRSYMLADKNSDGALQQYVKTYATTAINQFSAEYNKAIADDLGLEWYGYDGSLLTTSREFCIKCCDKQYIHISEFPKLLEGDFGTLGKIPLNKTTGLPNGMMTGTNADNLARRRGGWNCGHQMIAVSDAIVPKAIKEAVYATQDYKNWAAKNGKPQQVPEKQKPEIIKGLSIEKAKVVMKDYPVSESKKIALKNYTGADYNSINGFLRGKRKQSTEKNDETISTLSDFLENAPKVTADSYRGLTLDEYSFKTFKQYKKGDIYTDNGFMSTSYDKAKASTFGGNAQYQVEMVIKGKNGVLIEMHSDATHEKEILFNKGSNFKIESIKIKEKARIFGKISVTLIEV